MSDIFHHPSDGFTKNAHLNRAQYNEMYHQSIKDSEGFWSKHGERLDWIRPYKKVKNTSYAHPNVSIKWYEDGILNVSANCIDRHLAKRANQTAIIWEGDNPSDEKHITYAELHAKVSK